MKLSDARLLVDSVCQPAFNSIRVNSERIREITGWQTEPKLSRNGTGEKRERETQTHTESGERLLDIGQRYRPPLDS